jgi:hypothetical protein
MYRSITCFEHKEHRRFSACWTLKPFFINFAEMKGEKEDVSVMTQNGP